MSTEIREWFNEIWEYCQEHWTVVAAAGAVVLLLLVSFFLIRGAKRDDAAAGDLVPEDPLTDDIPAEPEAAADEVPEAAADHAQNVVEQLIKSVEAASGASGQKVESIELNIEKARLTIRYAGAPEEETELPEEPVAEPEKNVETEDFAGEAVQAEEADEPAAADESVKPKKFGAENMNRARSGRVYTEEELQNQIRD